MGTPGAASLAGISRIALGDLDGDGRLDVAFASPGENRCGVLWHAAARGEAFDPPTIFTVASPHGVAVGDLDGDGLPDFATTSPGVVHAELHRASTARAFSPFEWSTGDSTGAALATASISVSSPLQCRTMSQPAACAAHVRSASEPDNAPIDTSSLISSPLNPIERRITSCTIVTEVVAGLTGS